MAGCPAQPPRLRAGERGVARGRDRDRRLAPGRALPPARRADRRRRAGWKGSGRSIPRSTSMAASTRAPACSSGSAATAPQRASRSARSGSTSSPRRSPTMPRASSRTTTSRRVTRIDAVVPRGVPLTLGLCQELARLAPFGLGNPNVTLLAPACALGDLAAVGEGKHLRFRVRTEAGIDGGSAIAFGMGGQLDRYRATGSLRRRVPAPGEPLERNGRAAARCPAPLRHSRPLPRGSRLVRGRVQEGIGRESACRGGLPRAQARGRRPPSLLESERFREFLVGPAASACGLGFARPTSWQEPRVQRRTGLPMRFWRRRRMRRLNSLAALLIELDQLADGRAREPARTTVRF